MWPEIDWRTVKMIVRTPEWPFIVVVQATDDEQRRAFVACEQVMAIATSVALMGAVYERVAVAVPFPPWVTRLWWQAAQERRSGILPAPVAELMHLTWPQIGRGVCVEALRFRWAARQRVRRLREVPLDPDVLAAPATDGVTDLLTGLCLTTMERAVALGLGEGLAESDIADALGVSKGRVSQVKAALRRKLPKS